MSERDLLAVGVLVFLYALVIIGAVLQRNHEKKEWNYGRCRKCGWGWKQFDTDSQGVRGYKCPNNHTLWVSYNVDGGQRNG